MDKFLLVKFLWVGSFLKYGKEHTYVGGSYGTSAIEIEKIGLQEVRGRLCDHFAHYTEDMLMHWCLQLKQLWDGLNI
jgi:hypothetical protein